MTAVPVPSAVLRATAATTRPKRIQLKRTKGWRKPEGVIVVSRPTRWGNPWKPGARTWTVLPGGWIDRTPKPPEGITVEHAIASYRNSIEHDPDQVALIRRELGGKDLGCWCPLDRPCHADALLEISNPDLAAARPSPPTTAKEA